MTIRTTKKTVTFSRPFVLGGSDEVLPAGAYIVETDEELLEGISFPAYRRILTLIHLHAEPDHPGLTRTLTIDPNELEAALTRDHAPVKVPVACARSPVDGRASASAPNASPRHRGAAAPHPFGLRTTSSRRRKF